MLRWINRLLPRLLRSSPKTYRRPSSRRRPLVVEELERREVPSTVPVNIIDNTQVGSTNGLAPNQIYLFLEGNGQTYTIATNGDVTPGTPNKITLAGLTGNSINLPAPFTSARLYFSSQYITSEPGPNAAFYYDFVEPNVDGSGNLNVDTSQVNGYNFSMSIQVTPADAIFTNGSGTSPGLTRADVFNQYQSDMTGTYQGFQDGLSAGSPFRILDPSDVINGQLSAVTPPGGTTISITPNGGSAGNWQATLTISGWTPPAFRKGTVVSGSFLPAGTTISSSTAFGTTTIAIGSTSPSATTPFVAKSGMTGVNFVTPPTTQLASWFGPTWSSTANVNSGNALDNFFSHWSSSNPLALEDNGTGSVELYYGVLAQVTETDINGNNSTYAVLQFKNTPPGGPSATETYNIYYPYFTTNSPAGKTDPYGNNVPAPPSWWNTPGPLTNYEPPSQMIFGANGVFADNAYQPATSYTGSATVLADLERDLGVALDRGYATTLKFTSDSLSGSSLPSFSSSSASQGTWTLSAADNTAIGSALHTGMNVLSFASLTSQMIISSITTNPDGSASIVVTAANGTPLPGSGLTDNLIFFDTFQSGQTWNAYAAFLYSVGPFSSGIGGVPVYIDHRCYSESYSDYNGGSSDLNSLACTNLTITLDPWGNTGAPAAPTNLTATPGDAQIALNWTAASGATSYNIYRSTSPGGEVKPPIVSGWTGTSYTDASVTSGTTYYYIVTAVNSSGESPDSSQASATPTASPPQPPTNLTASAGNAQVLLNWTASSGATSYNIYRGTSPGGEGHTPLVKGFTGTSYTDASVTNSTTYYYVVTAVNGAGDSQDSNEAFATPAVPSATHVGVFRNGVWYLNTVQANYNPGTTLVVHFGAAGDTPVTGDWLGDGVQRIGVFRNGTWYLSKTNTDYTASNTIQINFGTTGDIPEVGHWLGGAVTYVGVFRPGTGTWHLSLNNQSWTGVPGTFKSFTWGGVGDQAVVGDWNGDGVTDVGVFRPNGGMWYLDQGNVSWNGSPVIAPFQFGGAGDAAVVGRWLGGNVDHVGVFRPSQGTWFLDKSHTSYTPGNAFVFAFGGPGDIPLIGQWLGDGIDYVAVFRAKKGQWYLNKIQGDYNSSTAFQIAFGGIGDLPVVGRW